jgi:hypothetical protein
VDDPFDPAAVSAEERVLESAGLLARGFLRLSAARASETRLSTFAGAFVLSFPSSSPVTSLLRKETASLPFATPANRTGHPYTLHRRQAGPPDMGSAVPNNGLWGRPPSGRPWIPATIDDSAPVQGDLH